MSILSNLTIYFTISKLSIEHAKCKIVLFSQLVSLISILMFSIRYFINSNFFDFIADCINSVCNLRSNRFNSIIYLTSSRFPDSKAKFKIVLFS